MPGTEGPEAAAWWVFDGVRTQIKRYVASAGVPAGEVTNQGITYDDMRPGCWQSAERIADMDVNGVQVSLPQHPRHPRRPLYDQYNEDFFLRVKNSHYAFENSSGS
jgi:hypothetical protein